MPPSNSPSNREATLLRFGVFEADLAAGELRKNGARIRLQGQPFQVLAALLQHAGQVVTRDHLRETIWPADTFVDFDHSLNTAVNKIREALGDSASSPRFVETMARRGYRFIAPVDGGAAESAASQTQGARAGAPAPHELHPELHVPFPRRGLVRALFALLQVMYLTFYVSGLAHLRAAERVASAFLPGWKALVIAGAVLVTGAVGIPLRFYLLSAVGFDFRKLGGNIRPAVPVCSGARSTLGHCAVSAAAADWSGPGVRRDCRLAVCAFLGENPGPTGLPGGT